MGSKKQTYTLEVVAKGLTEVVAELKVVNKSLRGNTRAKQDNADATKNQNTQSDHYNKQSKGTAGATNNQTKAFSKMTDGLTGGLVPAYAAVAANIFAITAAFGALERAADFQVMVDSAELLNKQTGRSLSGLAKNMQEITGGAITLKEAMTSASIAASAGFDNSTIKDLTRAATNASRALGRDMTDSLNRVFKGAVKAEPELLDELGIILRLDPATKKYASSLGKAATELTTFEKQQAVVNEVISQADEKFGSLSSINANAFTQLAAAFTDINQQLLYFVGLIASGPIGILTENTTLLTVAIIGLVKSVAGLAIPSLSKLGSLFSSKLDASIKNTGKSIDKTKDSFSSFQNSAKNVSTLTKSSALLDQRFQDIEKSGGSMSATVASALTKLREGFAITKKEAAAVVGSLDSLSSKKGKGISGYSKEDIKSNSDAVRNIIRENIALEKSANSLSSKYKEYTRDFKNKVLSATNGVAAATSASAKATAAAVGPVKTLTAAYYEMSKAAKSANVNTTFLAGGIERIAKIGGSAVGSIISMGSKVLSIVPQIGAAVFAWGLFTSAIHAVGATDLGPAMDDMTKALEDTKIAMDEFLETVKVAPTNLQELNKQLETQANIMVSLASSITESLREIGKEGVFDVFDDFIDTVGFGSLDTFKTNLEDIATQLTKTGDTKALQKVIKSIGGIGNISRLSKTEAVEFAKALKAAGLESSRFSKGTEEGGVFLKDSFTSLNKSLLELGGTLPNLSAAEKTFLGINSILSQMTEFDPSILITSLQEMSDIQKIDLGIKDEVDRMGPLISNIEKLKKAQAKLQAQSVSKSDQANPLLAEVNAAKTKRLAPLLNNTTDALARAESALDRYAATVSDKLGVASKAYRELAEAQDVFKTKEFSAKVEGLGTDKLKDRVRLTGELAAAEIQLNNTTRALDKTRATEATAKLATLEIELSRLKALPNKTTEVKSSIGVVEKNRTQLAEKLLQIENRLGETQKNSANVQIKYVQSLLKRLKSVQKFAGTTFFDGQADSIRTELVGALNILKKLAPEVATLVAGILPPEDEILAAVAAYRQIGVKSTGREDLDIKKDVGQSDALTKQIIDTERLIALNSDMNTKFDLRLDKMYLIRQEQLGAEVLVAAAEGQIDRVVSLTGLITKNDEARVAAMKLQGTLLVKNSAQTLKDLSAQTKLAKQNLAFKKAEENAQGLDPKELTKYLNTLKKIQKETNKISFAKEIQSAAGAMNDLAGAMEKFSENLSLKELNQTNNALLLLQSVGNSMEGVFGKMTKAFATVGLSAVTYNDTIKNIDDEAKRNKTDAKTVAIQKQAAAYGTVANSAGALAGIFEEGSAASKAFILIQQGAAIAAAATAVAVAAASGGPAGFATAAAMMGLMASVLGAASIAFGGGNSSSTVGSAPEKANEFGLRGSSSISNTLEGAMQDLAEVNTDLFSVERSLQLAIINLDDTFSVIAAGITRNTGIGKIGSFKDSETNSRDNPISGNAVKGLSAISMIAGGPLGGLIDGLIVGGLNSLFGSKTKTTESLQGLDLNLGVTASVVNDRLVAELGDAYVNQYVKVTTDTKKYFRTRTRITNQTNKLGIDSKLQDSLDKGMLATFNVINKTLDSLEQTLGIDIPALLGNFKLNIDPVAIDLFKKENENITESIAAYYSTIADSIFTELFPGLGQLLKEGQGFTDAIAEITENFIAIGSTFSKGGQDLLATIDTDRAVSEIFNPAVAAQKAARDNGPMGGIGEMAAQIIAASLEGGMEDFTFTDRFSKEAVAAAAENFKLETIKAWEDSFNSQFKDAEEFNAMYDVFLSTIFNDKELADIAVANATKILDNSKDSIIQQVEALELGQLDNILGDKIDSTSLRKFNDLAIESGAYFGTAGAILEATVITAGAALGNLKSAGEELAAALENLNEKYLRQIEAFGLLGKEVDLLNNSFDFADAIKEAEGTTTDLVLIETLYGLERLDIIRSYNSDISKDIEDTYSGIADSVLGIGKSFDSWDEVIFQAIKIDKISKKLSASLGGLDLSVFDIGDISGIQEFRDEFESILNISEDTPSTISEQIVLTNELKDSILSKYNEEIKAIEDTKTAWLEFSNEIESFLTDLKLGDLSTLTNSEQLALAQADFDANLSNIFSSDANAAQVAREGLLGSASALLEQASLFFAIGPQYQDIFNEVTGKLEALDQSIIPLDSNTEEDSLRELESIKLNAITQLSVLDSILIELEAANETQVSEDISFLNGISEQGFSNIVDKLSTLGNAIWMPIVNAINAGVVAPSSNTIEIPAFASGTPEVQFDKLAMIHKGEMIIPATSAASVRAGESIVSNGAKQNMSDNRDVVAAIQVLTEATIAGNIELLEQGERIEDSNKLSATSIGSTSSGIGAII